MINHGMKDGVSTWNDAKQYLKYMDDGSKFRQYWQGPHPWAGSYFYGAWRFYFADGDVDIELRFDDTDGPNSEGLYNPFSLEEDENGKLLLKDHQATNKHYALCQKSPCCNSFFNRSESEY